ncbi:TPA: hypothetical protein ACYEOW_003282 [Raoultella terrigena]
MSLSIKLPDHVYSGLLAEAKRQGTTVPQLIRQVLGVVAHQFDNGNPIPDMGNNNQGDLKNGTKQV